MVNVLWRSFKSICPELDGALVAAHEVEAGVAFDPALVEEVPVLILAAETNMRFLK